MSQGQFIIRDAVASDVAALAQLHVDTFIETHGGRGPGSIEKRRPPILTTGWYQALRVTRPPIAGSEKLSLPVST